MGQLYLTNIDFLKNGVPASIIAALVSHLHERLPSILLIHGVVFRLLQLLAIS